MNHRYPKSVIHWATEQRRAGASVYKIARVLGLHKNTVHYWLADVEKESEGAKNGPLHPPDDWHEYLRQFKPNPEPEYRDITREEVRYLVHHFPIT